MIPSGGADLRSHPRARGGLDTRLGASLEPWKDVSCQIYREWDTAGAGCAHVRFPAESGWDTAGSEDGQMACAAPSVLILGPGGRISRCADRGESEAGSDVLGQGRDLGPEGLVGRLPSSFGPDGQ